MPPGRKQEIVTFKVDDRLAEAMAGIQNRSEFIRNAILTALANTCPLCKGTGVLTPQQRDHWEKFRATHDLRVCEDCHAVHLTCDNKDDGASEA